MQRGVIGEFGRDDVRQQSRATQTPSDRADFRRPGGLEALFHRHRLRLAVLAGVALLEGAQDKEVSRLQVELLRRLRADADARPAAAGAAFLGLGQIQHDLAPRQLFGQGSAAMRVTLGCGLGVAGNSLRRAAFTAATEAVLQSGIEFAVQFGILGQQSCQLDEHLPQQGLERRHVVGQRRIGLEARGIHA